jgi:hypothetical protein
VKVWRERPEKGSSASIVQREKTEITMLEIERIFENTELEYKGQRRG